MQRFEMKIKNVWIQIYSRFRFSSFSIYEPKILSGSYILLSEVYNVTFLVLDVSDYLNPYLRKIQILKENSDLTFSFKLFPFLATSMSKTYPKNRPCECIQHTVRRDLMLETTFNKHPGAYRYMEAAYGSDSFLLFGDTIILSSEGRQQGDGP